MELTRSSMFLLLSGDTGPAFAVAVAVTVTAMVIVHGEAVVEVAVGEGVIEVREIGVAMAVLVIAM